VGNSKLCCELVHLPGHSPYGRLRSSRHGANSPERIYGSSQPQRDVDSIRPLILAMGWPFHTFVQRTLTSNVYWPIIEVMSHSGCYCSPLAFSQQSVILASQVLRGPSFTRHGKPSLTLIRRHRQIKVKTERGCSLYAEDGSTLLCIGFQNRKLSFESDVLVDPLRAYLKEGGSPNSSLRAF